MRKLKLLLAACALLFGCVTVNAETDYTSQMSSDWTGSSGNFGGGKERYQGSNYAAGKILYQSFTAPVAGIYEIKFYAVTSCTADRYSGSKYGDNIAQAYATAGGNKATVAMTVINQTGCTLMEAGNIRTLSVEAAEGETIEYGIENIAEGGNWYTIKELSAKMKTVAEIFQDQYDEAYAIWQYSTENETGARATFKTYVDALNTAMSGTLAEAQTASENLAAALVTYEGKSYPIKGNGVKYDFTSKMNMAINAWTCAQGNGPAQYGFTGATETYGNTNAGEVMYQTITGLASGEYEIHFYAVANAANGGGVEGTKATVYVNDQELEIDVIKQNGCTPSDYERTFTVMINDGNIQYGIKNTEAAGNWYICKNVALYMTGAPDLDEYYDVISEKLETANGLKSSVMNATVLTALQNAISGAEGYGSITVIGTLETISSNLTTAINNATTSIANYVSLKQVIDDNAAIVLNFTKDGQDFYSTASAEAIEAYDNRTATGNDEIATLKTAIVSACKAQIYPENGSDMTICIVNPNIDGYVDDNTMPTGWEIVKNGNGGYAGGPWKPSHDAMEFWGAGTLTDQDKGKGFDYYQTITGLPDGVYTIGAKLLNSTNGETGAQWNGGGNAGVYGKTGSAEVIALVTTDGESFNPYTTNGIAVYDGTLRLGVKNINPLTGRWFACDDFELTYVRQLPTISSVTLAGSFNGWNTESTEMESVVDSYGSYSCELDLTGETGNVEFKPVVNGGDYLGYSAFTIDAPAGWISGSGDSNITLNNSSTVFKTYVITATWLPEGWKLKVEGKDVRNEVSSVKFAYDGNWDGLVLTKDPESYTYSATLDLSETTTNKPFKLRVDEAWYGQNEVVVNAPDGFITAGSDKGNITLNHATTYYETYNVTATWILNSNSWSLAIAGTGDLKEPFTVGPKEWATAKTTNAVDFTGVEGLKAYIATLSGDVVTLTEATEVPANTPIVLKGATKKVNIIASADPIGENALTWYDSYKVNDSYAHIYALTFDDVENKAKFARVANELTFYNKAVIEIMQGGGARELSIVFADETTGIQNLSPALSEGDGAVYDLQGRKVAQPTKGLYIVNGKKVVKK